MYGFIRNDRVMAYPTLKECLKHARTDSMRKAKSGKSTLGDVLIMRFPKEAIGFLYLPELHSFTIYGMGHIIGNVWTKDSKYPQYETKSGNHSRDILTDGSLGKIGWERIA